MIAKALFQCPIDNGIGFNELVDVFGQTALRKRARTRDQEDLGLLLAAGADSNITCVHSHNALIAAARYENLEAVQTLLPLTTNLNTQMLLSDTALSEAAGNGHHAIVEALLDAGVEEEPQEPGPHCAFLKPSERRSGLGNSAYITALASKDDAAFRAILRFDAQRDPQSHQVRVLRFLDRDCGDSFNFETSVQAIKRSVMNKIISHSPEENQIRSMFAFLITFTEDHFSRFNGYLVSHLMYKQTVN